MALVKCQHCGGDVAHDAKTCPHCNSTSPVAFPKGCLLIIVAVIAVFMLYSFVSDLDFKAYDKGKTKNFQILSEELNNSGGRKELKIVAYAQEAASIEDRAATVAHAAKSWRKVKNADTVIAFLMCAKDQHCATAEYIPDQKGWSGKEDSFRWRISSTDEPTPPFYNLRVIHEE